MTDQHDDEAAVDETQPIHAEHEPPADPADVPAEPSAEAPVEQPGGPVEQQWPPPPPGTRPMPPMPPMAPPPPPAPPVGATGEQRRSRRSRRTWPAVALLALVVGLAGGFGGAAVYAMWFDEEGGTTSSSPGQVRDGLDDVELDELPPIEEGGTVSQVAQEVLPSTVQIIAAYQGEEAGATGSGFVLDGEGHIITNNHVVESAAEDDGPIEIVDSEGNRYDAEVVGRSPVYDLAVLYAEDASDLAPASLGRSQVLRVGDPVVAIGAPLGYSFTVTSGIVSALDRPVSTGNTADDSSYINAVQTDAAINQGNSGGPLVDRRGQVVGVNSAIATSGSGANGDAGNIGIGFAIPVEQLRVTVDQILRTGEARYPVIGAKVRTGGIPTGEGAELDEILDDSPAQEAGLRKDDLITHVDGDRVTDGIALIVAIRTHQPGETITFTVVRDGEEREVEVTLDGEVG